MTAGRLEIVPAGTSPSSEVAPGVHRLEVGRGLMRSNVYLVEADASWALVDAGSGGCGKPIREAAAALFGPEAGPAAILLTHDHPDHAGSARELAEFWNVSVWVHPDERLLAEGDVAAIGRYANPLDRWVILPVLRLMGSSRFRRIVAESSLAGVVRSFDPAADPPGLPGWTAVPTPGHTPGHVAFFRRADRVALTGDALLTLELNSPAGLMRRQPHPAGPPWYTSWSRRACTRSIADLARLEPTVVAAGHGLPLTLQDTGESVRAFASQLARPAQIAPRSASARSREADPGV